MNTASGIIMVIGCLPYVWAMITGETVASPVSWIIWATVDALALFAMMKEGARCGQIIGTVVGAGVIAVLSLFLGKPTMGSMEWVSIVGATAGIILWQTTGNPVTAIVCSQAAVLIGAVPTVVGAYQNPALEDPLAWCLWLVSCICALLAIRKWNLANALQPLTFTAIETTMVFLLVIRPRWF